MQCMQLQKGLGVREDTGQPNPRLVCVLEVYDLINAAHVATGHGKSEATFNHLKSIAHNISEEVVKLYIDHCIVCQSRVRLRSKHLVVKPMLSKAVNWHVSFPDAFWITSYVCSLNPS